MKGENIIKSKGMAFVLFAVLSILMVSTVYFGDDSIPGETPTVNVRGKVNRVLDSCDDEIKYSGGSIEN